MFPRDDDPTAQTLGFEIERDVGFERGGEVSLERHAAEPALSPGFHRRTGLLPPIDNQDLAAWRLRPVPRHSHTTLFHRECAEAGGIAGEFVQREAEALRRFGLEEDGRTLHCYPPDFTVEVS